MSSVHNNNYIDEKKTYQINFYSRMSIAMVTDPPGADLEDYLSEMLTQHLLQAACGQTHNPVLPYDHFKQFLSVASSLQVRLSLEAKHMLQSFYIASRRVRTSSIHSSDMPNSALNSMCALALAHARLSLRAEVEQCINLCTIVVTFCHTRPLKQMLSWLFHCMKNL